MSEVKNLSQLAKGFSDEDEAYRLMERIRWPGGRVVCPHCGVVGKAYYLEPKDGHRTTRTGKTTHRRVWKCAECRQQFSVLVGTIFEDSRVPLSKWLLAVHMMCADKNGVAAYELHRTLGVAYRTAWFMAHRIREAMKLPPLVDKLAGTVEADETYIGGKAKGKRGRGALNKVPVVTLVERDGEARSQAMHAVTSANIDAVLSEQVDEQATIFTDELNVYTTPGKKFAAHETVAHGKGEYSRGEVHINTAEGYFSQLKRSIDGTHHHVSERHLPRYLAEFDYRYSTRKMKDGVRTEQTIRRAAGKRLRYQVTVHR
jgi:transposase-like protein